MRESWLAAKNGALSGIFWWVPIGVYASLTHSTSDLGLLGAYIILGTLFGLFVGAILGVVLVKVRPRIPTRSQYSKSCIFSVVVWLITAVIVLSAGGHLTYFLSMISLATVLAWGVLFTFLLEAERKRISTPFDPRREYRPHTALNEAVGMLLLIISIVLILALIFMVGRVTLALALVLLTAIGILATRKKQRRDIDRA